MIYITEASPKKLSGLSSLFISFKYNPDIVAAIKTSDKYIFDKTTTSWEVPVTSLAYLLDILTYIDDISLVLLKEDDNKDLLYPILEHEYPPFEHQLEGITYGLQHDSWLLLDSPGMGKAFTLDTNIVTPEGYKEIKDIHPGDVVYDECGNPCNVKAEYNHDALDMYKVTFSTGESITCCKDHLWQVLYDKPIWNKETKDYDYTHFEEVHDINWLLEDSRYKKYCMRIPFCNPINFEKKNHIIHPYVLGCLIGDGSITRDISITTCDQFIADKISNLLPPDLELHQIKDSVSYRICKKAGYGKYNSFVTELKRLDLYGHNSYNKFIPDEYLYDCVENRIALLQGLMDTDGTVAKRISSRDAVSNAAHFGTSSDRLKNNFEFLIQSLGGYCYTRSFTPSYYNRKYKEKRISKHNHFTTSIHMNNMQDIFTLPRKLDRVSERKFKIRRKFKSIEYVGKAPGKCITVDSPNHLYLADKCIVTHNTIQMIYLAEELKAQKGLEHCLIICGINTLKANWKKEIRKYSKESCRVLGEKISRKGRVSYGSVKERAAELLEPLDAFFIIINIEALRTEEMMQALKKTKNNIGMIVLDEAHKCKSSSTQQGSNLLKLSNYEHKIGLTGTLVMNRPIDAYTALKWIGVEKANLSTFKSQYCVYGGFGGHQIVGYKNLDLLKAEIESCSLRRRKEDLKDFPSKTVINELVEMEDSHRKFYENIQDGVRDECDKVELNTNSVLALTTRLRQATTCPSTLSSNPIISSKIQRAVDLVEEICADGEKVVIMSTFKETLNVLNDMLSEYNPLLNTGDVPDDQVSKNIDLFQTDPKYKVFLGTTSKCGTGITLNAATYMICCDMPWTPALQEQVEDRINRINNTKPVCIYRLICQNTIDEVVANILDVKQAVSDYIIDDKSDAAVLNILKNYILDL